jgi:aminopeptidase N
MQGLGARRFDPELKQIVSEASQALALLDADRLEELARACQALNRGGFQHPELVRQARDAAAEMAVFARVLDATRDNLTVMNRLRDLRLGRVDYTKPAAQSPRWGLGEICHGND